MAGLLPTHLLHRWRALWHPERYHGWGRKRRYFEGWYVRLVSPCEQYALALIPGIAMDEQGETKAFIQFLDGKACRTAYHDFSASDFRPATDAFCVEVGGSTFSSSGLQLDLPEVKGRLQYDGTTPWPSRLGAPGIMGWYSFVPFMECYHGIVSLHHRLRGQLTLYGKPVDFSGGVGYMEKDWGRSFPSSWIWMQCNHLSKASPACLMVSIARIPWLGQHFVGFLSGLLLNGKLYEFTTYNGAKARVDIDEENRAVSLHFRRKPYEMRIQAQQEGGSGTLLSPLSGAMAGKVNESLQSTVAIELYEGSQLLYKGNGRHAGLEVAGPARTELEGDS